MKVSIIIPAFNEEDRIQPMLDLYLAHFVPLYGDDMECVVIVNGSDDRTAEICRGYAARFPQVRVTEERRAIGKGGAVMLGFREARGELVGFVDADGATPPDAFQALIEGIGSAGAIIASRWLPASSVSPPQPLSRRIASRIFNGMVRILFDLPITDTQCGAKLMKREAVAAILPNLGLTQWAFDVDLLFQLRRAGYGITEIPTTWHDVLGSKVNVPKASAQMTIAILRLRLIHSPFRWVVTLYNATIGRVLHGTGEEPDD